MARIKYYDAAEGVWKYGDNVIFVAPVQSVNGQTGGVALTAADVNAEPSGAIDAHNTSAAAHEDIRAAITAVEGKAMLKSDVSIKKAQLTLEDGTEVLIDVVVASEGTTIQTYTNRIPASIASDGSIYNGKGYNEALRLSSSGAEKTMTTNISNGSIITGFIPAKGGDVIRMANCPWIRNNTDSATDGSTNYLCAYKSDFTFVGGQIGNLTTGYGTWSTTPPTYKYTIPDGSVTTDYVEITLPDDANIAYIRMNCASGVSNQLVVPQDVILTVNEEIA